MNRSALIRQALQEHLKRIHALELEERDGRVYQVQPQERKDARIWEKAAIWPEV